LGIEGCDLIQADVRRFEGYQFVDANIRPL
jgi:hypothetical protein